MKIVYTAPNRAHHYTYASALHRAGVLHAFVSGFPRISPQSKTLNFPGKICHSDFFQTIYLLSLRSKFPHQINSFLAYISKIEQDLSCKRYINNCDIFLFYSGSGLFSCRKNKKNGGINIVEAVNSHVEYQENLLEEEYKNLNLKWKPFPVNEKERRLSEYEEADYILLPSSFVKDSFIAKGFKESKLLQIPYGFNKQVNSFKAYSVNRESFTILYVGSISVRKGIRYLINAFNKLDHPKKKLLLVGPDANDGALNGIALNSNIVFTGILKDEKLAEVYQSADVFCLPSIEEGLALVIGEAISYGVPIIATTNSGASDIITDGIEGFIVPIRDSE